MGVYQKDGKFYPDKAFSETAWIDSLDQYQNVYNRSVEDPEGFWSDIASELHWFKNPESVLNYNFDIRKGKVFHEWFKGGYTNVCYNCLDRHLDTPTRNRAALVWQGEPEEDTKILTYLTLHREVCRFANV